MIVSFDVDGFPIWGLWHVDAPQCRRCMLVAEVVNEWEHRIVATF